MFCSPVPAPRGQDWAHGCVPRPKPGSWHIRNELEHGLNERETSHGPTMHEAKRPGLRGQEARSSLGGDIKQAMVPQGCGPPQPSCGRRGWQAESSSPRLWKRSISQEVSHVLSLLRQGKPPGPLGVCLLGLPDRGQAESSDSGQTVLLSL